MTRRALLAVAAAAPATAAPPAAGMNVLLIMADDMGWGDLSCYGCPDINTPNIDSIGRQGVRMTCFYANAPECTPTRAGLLTGRYQQRVGGLECAIGVGNVGRYDEAEWLAGRGELGLPPEEISLARMLRQSGYATCCSGKWHLGYAAKFSANAHGFDEYFGVLGGNADYVTHREEDGTLVLSRNGNLADEPGHITNLLANHAIGWLERARPQGKPFFLYVPFTAPHTPLQAPGDAAVSAASRWNEGTRATYIRMVEHMDRRVGDLLAALGRSGQAANTLVVFKSDNGGYNMSRNTPLRAGKSTVWEGGIRVPCLLRWPGVIPAGAESPQVGMSMDLAATILAAARVTPSRKLDGVDLMPVITRRRAAFSRQLFWSYKRAATRRWAARDGDWKYVVDNGEEALHNLADDEREQRNLLAAEPERAARLRSVFAVWKKETAPARLGRFSGAR